VSREEVPANEHILLESDERTVPDLRTARKVHTQLRIRSRVRRCAIELTLIDYHYLAVREWRSKSLHAKYVLDLRFVDPRPRISRHVAWRFMTASAVLFAVGAFIAREIVESPTPWWQHSWLSVCAGLLLLAFGTAFISLYRTTETLSFRSVNGQVRVLEYTGGLGTLRIARRFSHLLAAHLRVARAARRRSRIEHLRDEMREHHRLREAGVLSEQDYEDGKRRILAAHALQHEARKLASPSKPPRVAYPAATQRAVAR